jgi:hypothetical protein
MLLTGTRIIGLNAHRRQIMLMAGLTFLALC